MKNFDFKSKTARRPTFALILGYLAVTLSLLTFQFSLFGITAAGQDDSPEIAPPPLKVITKDEAARLAAKTDIKDRTKLSVDLLNIRLAAAEKFSLARDFDSMYRELGFFHALMDDALDFLAQRDTGRGKVLDNFKRLEIALRGMAPKLAVIRRELPQRYDPYIRTLMGFVRSARAKATDSLFDDTVIPQKKPGN